jgi:hypothetical protein
MSMPRLCFRSVVVAALLTGATVPASAQGGLAAEVVGEDYHVEVSFNFWKPTPEPIVRSESLGIIGSDINLVTDLGIESHWLKDFSLVLRPATKHRFRIDYLGLNYEAEATLQRAFVFNGLRYPVGLPVSTTAKFNTWRFGYEYDFLYTSRGFLGVLLDAKVTDVDVGLNSPIGDEFNRQLVPIPTIGGVGRVYVHKNVSLNGEVSYFKIPESAWEDYGGRYIDFDVSGVFNMHKNVAAQLGYRSIDVYYQQRLDSGTLTFNGWYLGFTTRF